MPVASASGAPAVYRTPFVNRNGVVSRNPDAVWNDPVEHVPLVVTPVPGGFMRKAFTTIHKFVFPNEFSSNLDSYYCFISEMRGPLQVPSSSSTEIPTTELSVAPSVDSAVVSTRTSLRRLQLQLKRCHVLLSESCAYFHKSTFRMKRKNELSIEYL